MLADKVRNKVNNRAEVARAVADRRMLDEEIVIAVAHEDAEAAVAVDQERAVGAEDASATTATKIAARTETQDLLSQEIVVRLQA